MSQAPPQPSAGRYPRNVNGLVSSLLVCLLVVGSFVGLRACGRDDLEVQPEPVDYLGTVQDLQAAGQRPVYPAQLPQEWLVTSLDVVPGEPGAWGLGMLTGSGRFAGLRQEDAALERLLETYVDDEPTEGQALAVPGGLAATWRAFADAGGDHAYAARVGDDWVVVYGSAPPEELRALLEVLTTDER